MRTQPPRLLGWRIVLPLGLMLVSGIAGTAQATTLFTIDSTQSTLSVESASFFALTPSGTFNTTLDPNGLSNFIRPLSGTVVADAVTGDVESLDLLVLGDPLVADQIRLDSRGNPRDIGDFSLANFGVAVDALSAVFTAGMIEFDLSLGAARVSSVSPISIAGVSTPAVNIGGPVTVMQDGLVVTLVIPVEFTFADVLVIQGGELTISLAGTIAATTVIPEPTTAVLVALGLFTIALDRRRGLSK